MTTEQSIIAHTFAQWLGQYARQAAHFTPARKALLNVLEARIAAEALRTLADLCRKIVVADAGGDMNLSGQQVALAREARSALGLPPLVAPGGLSVPELCREHGISSATFYKWRARYGGMDASMMSQSEPLSAIGPRTMASALEDENRRLKRMFADLSMQADLLREAPGKK